ncbi:MAG TPA: hypothetical protein V6C81_25410 [Planktothrix sp.]|jgi:hypothetical protein
MNRRLKVFLVSMFAASAVPIASAHDAKPVTQSQVIEQPINIVWSAIQGLRTCDPEHRKLISYHNNEALIEEKFFALPVVGDTSCTYKECEVPPNQIKYTLIKSDHFRQFEGSWTLTPMGENKTMVCLSSTLDAGLRIPFWKEITKTATKTSVLHRLKQLSSEADRVATLHGSIAARR